MLAVWSFRGVVAFAMTALPAHAGAHARYDPDARVLGYAFALTLAAGVVFGLLRRCARRNAT